MRRRRLRWRVWLMLALTAAAGLSPGPAAPQTEAEAPILRVPGGSRLKATSGDATSDEVVVRSELSIQAAWQRPKVAWVERDDRWRISTLAREVVPAPYDRNGQIELHVTIGRNEAPEALRLTADLQVVDLLGGSKGAFTHQAPLSFDKQGLAVLRFRASELLNGTGTLLNRNALEARVTLRSQGRARPAITEKPLHILRQKLILFIPGVGGSRITVASHPNEEAYPEVALLAGSGDRYALSSPGVESNWLGSAKDGIPRSKAIRLDLLRQFGIEVYNVEDRADVTRPAGHPQLYMRRGAGDRRKEQKEIEVPYYVVKAWPYDWRLRLQDAVDLLMGPDRRLPGDPVWPPYQTPPSLARIIAEARRTHPLMDRRIALASHSTGGLITRAALMRAGIENYVDKAFFVNVPFWGAPKAYYVFLTGEMMPFIRYDFLRHLAPNLPIVYYLAPTEQYPDPVALVEDLPAGAKCGVMRARDQSVADFMGRLIAEARRKGNYPSATQIEPWNEVLEREARAFHRSIQGSPRIGFENTTVFWSKVPEDTTVGQVEIRVKLGIESCAKAFAGFLIGEYIESISASPTAGDTTVPVLSQVADFPPGRTVGLRSRPAHVPAPNDPQVWEKIIESVSVPDD